MRRAAFAAPAPVALRSRLSGALAGAWRRARPQVLLALPIVLVAVALAFGVSAWRASRVNETMAALDAGRDVAVSAEADPALLLARVRFLATRSRQDEAEPLVEALERRGAVRETGRARAMVANARMRLAFDLLSRSDLDRAGPQVTLARQDYRRALEARPDDWDAKFNLDVASRLIRDYPEFDRKSGDELKAEPKQIWTDIPGQPRGGP
ncbi:MULTISPECIES: MxaK protein [Methylobacterium]|uniref:MxaK protein n=2 Tax=Pseudomonadota TaxID=1224 RepID=A0ABQ4SUE1_9HYPH|nr:MULTISPECIES: MxaK protein [Methylobacterium]PIU06526.1 MAG: MxaK protein [Methylobacterium sp. CG09_land_8_20_14_0_10_71_15]PIU11094.1 MAG: MxaK protein [Methylobacterium sp. CG08_land_8_20_14_0_20_71_15]GBU16487.1 hypothetical protein AwMethylo_07020 [Methylobacterium sp.]GJE06094.1 hypothetical protein AOPFMNJM_1400 [Methylobacterium jeotgali]